MRLNQHYRQIRPWLIRGNFAQTNPNHKKMLQNDKFAFARIDL